MNMPQVLSEILTEFDNRISSELNLDPLGLLVVWSSYGQRIFRGRLNSISNDVRSYTLNLFNHWVIKSVVEDDGVQLGKGLQQDKAYAGRGKDALAFKQACLTYLENVFAYCMVDAQAQPGVETNGVLGISKARSKWSDGNPQLLFSHGPRAHVLVRQNLLGVSGRYKTPLVQMGFFDAQYDYALPSARALWQKVQREMMGEAGALARLQKLARMHLEEVVTDPSKVPVRHFAHISTELKKTYTEAFKSPAVVGAYARNFWLSVTELDQGSAGALYHVLRNDKAAELAPSAVFERAVGQSSLLVQEKSKLQNVRLLEPFLSELTLLFDVMLSEKSQSLNEAAGKWKSLGRNDQTLPLLVGPVIYEEGLRGAITGTAAERLDCLLDVARETNVRQQMLRLLDYHSKIMSVRRQSPWVRLLDGERLKVDVAVRSLQEKGKRRIGEWVNNYYVPQFRHLLSGLWGSA